MKVVCNSLIIFLIILKILFCSTRSTDYDDNINYETIGGFFEGDMELPMARNGLTYETSRWPNATVTYRILDNFSSDQLSYIYLAMQNIERVSCLRFIPAQPTDENFVMIVGLPTGCHSQIGYLANVQFMNLQKHQINRGCFKFGTILHEFLHVLGFHHQQSVPNRDEYVEIVTKNVRKEMMGNFQKYDRDTLTDFGVEYDYGSVMHYSSKAFSKNGRNTIIPLRPTNAVLGQRVAMSSSDIEKLNLMYNCYDDEYVSENVSGNENEYENEYEIDESSELIYD